MKQNIIGRRLREERDRIGKSQQALADGVGVSKQTVQNWEKWPEGGTPIPADKLDECGRQGMDVQYIVTGVRSENLLRVAEETGAWRLTKEPTQNVEVDRKVLAGVIAGVDEYLVEQNKKMPPDKKAELVVLLCDFLTADVAADKKAVKSAVSKIIDLRSARR